jgi:hypothetical protein
MIGALKFGHGTLRHEQRIRFDLRLRAHATVLARTQNEIRVGKESNDLQRAGVGIDLPVGEGKFSFFGINRTVGKESAAIRNLRSHCPIRRSAAKIR